MAVCFCICEKSVKKVLNYAKNLTIYLINIKIYIMVFWIVVSKDNSINNLEVVYEKAYARKRGDSKRCV